MEGKKILKISMIFVIIAIIVVVAIVFYIDKTNSNKEIADLKENISSLQNEIAELNKEKSNNNIDNTVNTENTTSSENVINENNVNDNTTTTEPPSSDNTTYSEITETLQGSDVLLVTDAIDNQNGTYTLKGKVQTVDTSSQQETEYPTYKETGEYKQITVPSDTECVYSVDSYEESKDIVSNVFSKKLYFGGCFNFKFENGKCVSVYEIVTGH